MRAPIHARSNADAKNKQEGARRDVRTVCFWFGRRHRVARKYHHRVSCAHINARTHAHFHHAFATSGNNLQASVIRRPLLRVFRISPRTTRRIIAGPFGSRLYWRNQKSVRSKPRISTLSLLRAPVPAVTSILRLAPHLARGSLSPLFEKMRRV